MIDLPGLLLGVTAVVLTILAVVIEVSLPPRRLDWKEYLAFQMSFALFFAFVFTMYLATRIPRLDRPEVFGVLRTFAYGVNPLIGLTLLLLLARYDLVSPTFRQPIPLLVPPILLVSATLLGMLVLRSVFVGFIGILGGRLYLLAVAIALTASAYSREQRRIARPLAAFLVYWLGLTAIEIFLDFVPDAIRLLNIWYVLGAILHMVWTVVSIARRRHRVSRATERFARSEDRQSAPESGPELLTAREVEIARAIAAGETYREVAEQFALTKGQAKSAIYGVYRSLGVHDRIELRQALS